MLLCVDVTDADDVVKLGKAARVVYVCFFFYSSSVTLLLLLLLDIFLVLSGMSPSHSLCLSINPSTRAPSSPGSCDSIIKTDLPFTITYYTG